MARRKNLLQHPLPLPWKLPLQHLLPPPSQQLLPLPTLLLLPPLATAATVLLANLFADAAISPLSLAELIGRLEYPNPRP